ncbi:MAG: DUF2630 family protein [Acidimicrobiales bacterium]|jgi:hypothetical protein
MEDEQIIARITKLAGEERRLEEGHVGRVLTPEEHARLRSIERTLDQLWDLLRQRRALRGSGGLPDEAVARPEETVEGYLQ